MHFINSCDTLPFKLKSIMNRGVNKMQDLVGRQFGEWLVLEFAGRRGQLYYWRCKCSCGKIKEVKSTSLLNGTSLSCGHSRSLLGEVYGNLVVTRFIEGVGSESYCECKCACGNIVSVRASNLKNGNTTSCGCVRKFKDLTGQKFNKLTVLGFSHKNKTQYFWNCQCDCGKLKVVRTDNLKNGTTVSCGCYKNGLHTTHGKSNTREYRRWLHMKQRCCNSNNKDYSYYGGRGIKLCKEWETYEGFLKDMGIPPTDYHEIDRIDNDGNYCKENCRWVGKKTQAQNKRNSVLLTLKGRTKCVSEWARILGIPVNTLRSRVRAGMSDEEALETLVQNRTDLVDFNGESKTMKEWSEKVGVSVFTLKNRLYKLNWSVEKTLSTPVETKYSRNKNKG